MQTTSHLLMVRPAAFGFNEETAASNAFQQNDLSLSKAEIREQARHEFDGLVAILRAKGIMVWVVEDLPEPQTPDAVFPNNWLTMHKDGTVVLYPMFAQVRRKERDKAVLSQVQQAFEVKEWINLTGYEAKNQFLEGTGSLILDHVHKIAYACLSPRTDAVVMADFCEKKGFRAVLFTATDAQGMAIYHTNVMMALGTSFVVICLAAIEAEAEREKLLAEFAATQKEVISISREQMAQFAGNMLQVQNTAGETFLVMSKQAFDVLEAEQMAQIQQHTQVLYAPLETIEKYGGGSARCMMAEIFLPQRI